VGKDVELTVRRIANMENEEIPDEFKFPKESRVGKSMTQKTTKRVILTVLSLLFLIPTFTWQYWLDVKHHYIFDLKLA
jgi:hypothetical protein